jgi:hypothetical protein
VIHLRLRQSQQLKPEDSTQNPDSISCGRL